MKRAGNNPRPRAARGAILAALALALFAGAVPGRAQSPVPTDPGDRTLQAGGSEMVVPGRAIGLESAWEVEIPGSLLDVGKYSARCPVELRIEQAIPTSDGYRYTFRFTILEPGRHDLAPLLERRDGTPGEDLPKLVVETGSLLPPDQILGVKPVRIGEGLRFGGYTRMMILLAIAWVVGLALLIRVGRKRAPKVEQIPDAYVPTAADLLQPLVLRAAEGTLDKDGKARLERLFIAFWREKLRLGEAPMTRVMATLRKHKTAGELMENLSLWFHSPSQSPKTDVAILMEPYRQIAAADIESRLKEAGT